jgi:hypothetical protein
MAIQAIRNTALAAIMLTLAVPTTVHAGGVGAGNQLVRPGVVDTDAFGSVQMKANAAGTKQVVIVQAFNVDTALIHQIWIENPNPVQPFGLDAWVYVDDMNVQSVKKGRMTYAVRTKQGDVLPFGFDDVSELEGLQIEIRNTNNDVVLVSEMPSLEAQSRKAVVSVAATDESKVSGKLQVRTRKGNGAQVFNLNVKGLAWNNGQSYRMVIETNAGNGVFTDVGAVVRKGKKGVLKIRTRKGERLPMGVMSLQDLGGRSIEVRQATQTQGRLIAAPIKVVLQATVPAFTG